MGRWSPRTKLKYGLCRLDSNGKTVSIWNFGDLDEALKETKTTEESSNHGALALCEQFSLPSANDFVIDTVVEVTECFAVTMETNVPPVPPSEIAVDVTREERYTASVASEEGVELIVSVHNAAVQRQEVTEDGEDFYADMPRLEPPKAWVHEFIGMPDLESCIDTIDTESGRNLAL
ncbi:hypothetical protein M758_UG332800 [Ceratodon purpureus]|nr:hypothetical protein M758_UG332800 [Ceratodon purpureus]